MTGGPQSASPSASTSSRPQLFQTLNRPGFAGGAAIILALAACSLARSDRTAKYNQLIRIAELLDDQGVYAGSSTIAGR